MLKLLNIFVFTITFANIAYGQTDSLTKKNIENLFILSFKKPNFKEIQNTCRFPFFDYSLKSLYPVPFLKLTKFESAKELNTALIKKQPKNPRDNMYKIISIIQSDTCGQLSNRGLRGFNCFRVTVFFPNWGEGSDGNTVMFFIYADEKFPNKIIGIEDIP